MYQLVHKYIRPFHYISDMRNWSSLYQLVHKYVRPFHYIVLHCMLCTKADCHWIEVHYSY